MREYLITIGAAFSLTAMVGAVGLPRALERRIDAAVLQQGIYERTLYQHSLMVHGSPVEKRIDFLLYDATKQDLTKAEKKSRKKWSSRWKRESAAVEALEHMNHITGHIVRSVPSLPLSTDPTYVLNREELLQNYQEALQNTRKCLLHSEK